MNKIITCPLDCLDLCQIEVVVEGDEIVSLKGDKTHPLTKGFICNKGRDHLKRHLDPERLRTPMKKINGEWIEITYDEAESMIVENLKRYNNYEILHYYDSGYGGINKEVDGLFFNAMGGVVRHRGSLCWAAGIAATEAAFSDVVSADFEELTNSDVIVLWGRNPADTNVHLANLIMEEKKKGKRVIVIDPLKTNSRSLTTDFIEIEANTDHILALGIIKYLYDEKRLDTERICDLSEGWDGLLEEIGCLTLNDVSSKTGVEIEQIVDLANLFSTKKVMTYIGYGLQRYRTGGNVVKSINALCFSTFNYGEKGRGVNYGDRGFSKKVDTYLDRMKKEVTPPDTYVMSKFGEYVLTHDIKMLFITKANPLVQLPNLEKVYEAFEKVEFKVGIDLFMTDSMNECDLVLPATSIFEEEDIIFTSMFSPFLQYSEQVLENSSIKGEYELFQSLASKMVLKNYPIVSKEDYLKDAIRLVLEEHEMTFEEFKAKKRLRVHTKKQYEAMDKFKFSCELKEVSKLSEYPLRLITPHHKNSLHSQGFKDIKEIPEVFMSQNTYERFVRKSEVIVESEFGKLIGKAVVSDISDKLIMIYEGYWKHSGEVNRLTTDDFSDIGNQAAYYDTFVKVSGR